MKMEVSKKGMLKKYNTVFYGFFILKTREVRLGRGTQKPCIKREGWDKGTQTNQYPVSRGVSLAWLVFSVVFLGA